MSSGWKFSILLSVFSFLTISAQNKPVVTLEKTTELFNKQLGVFPQEKIYIHTDKQYYMSGETVWFRAHLMDAHLHQPAMASRYVYIELIDPLDSVVTRLKIRPEDNAYQGYIPLPEDMPEGSYFIRAYTHFMQNAGPDYFAKKDIYIGSPQAADVFIESSFSFESGKKMRANLSFRNVKSGTLQVPDKITFRINNQNEITLKEPSANVSFQFDLDAGAKKRQLCLDVILNSHLYRKYISIPVSDNLFDVGFYPEGGDLLEETACKVAFKVTKPNGLAGSIIGKVFDQSGNEILEFNTIHAGMGSFILTPEKGKTYYALCENDQKESLRFELPKAKQQYCALKTRWFKGQLVVGVQKTPDLPSQQVYIVGHTRGIVQFAGAWDFDENFIQFPQTGLYPGVMHIVLLNESMQVISERLVFVNNKNVILPKVDYSTDMTEYGHRQLVNNQVVLTDDENRPITGNFSVAVTDDQYVKVDDNAETIMTNLLLSSDVRGYIDNPAYYFKNNKEGDDALDLLMLTQGWRRYDISRIMKGDYATPVFYLEVGPEISGKVSSALLLGKAKAVPNTEVTAIGMNTDYSELAKTDSSGRFYFHHCEFPDSVKYMIHAVAVKGLKRTELTLNNDIYPEVNRDLIGTLVPDNNLLIDYIGRADKKYISENGMRMIYLDEVEIRAKRKTTRTSHYYTHSDHSMNADDISKFGAMSMKNLLLMFPGIQINGNNVTIAGASGPPLLMVNDVISDIGELDMIDPVVVDQIDLLKNGSNTVMFGQRGYNGVIVIYYKKGQFSKELPPTNIQIASPLGYQPLVEFYAPKYDTSEARNNPLMDLRTTIHWQPQVKINEQGIASFEFYSADTSSEYSVIIQGVTDNGKIIDQIRKVVVK